MKLVNQIIDQYEVTISLLTLNAEAFIHHKSAKTKCRTIKKIKQLLVNYNHLTFYLENIVRDPALAIKITQAQKLQEFQALHNQFAPLLKAIMKTVRKFEARHELIAA